MASIKVFMKDEEREPEIIGVPKVPKDKSKTLINTETGEIIYFIDKNYGIKNKLMSKMNFKIIHPTHTNMCELTIPINRVD
jgi:hypothetical protein